MQLYRAILISSFTRGSKRLWLDITLKLGVPVIACILLGMALAITVPKLPPLPHALIWCSSIVGMQLTILCALVCAETVVKAENRSILIKLLLTLPIYRYSIWLTTLLPSLIVILIVSILVVPVMVKLLIMGGISTVAIVFAPVIAIISSLGFVYGLPRRLFTYAFVAVIVWLEYICTQALLKPSSHFVPFVILGFIISLSFALFLHSKTLLLQRLTTPRINQPVRTMGMPSSFWHVKKILRSTVTKYGVWITLVMSFTFVVFVRKFSLDTAEMRGMIAAVLAAALCADFRSTTRRYKPAEITNLQGVIYFWAKQLLSALILPVLCTIPLLISTPTSAQMWASLLLGICSGLFSGIWLAPRTRDIGAQCCAVLVALTILLLPVILRHDMAAVSLIVIDISLACGMVGLGLFIEKQRNNFRWRRHV